MKDIAILVCHRLDIPYNSITFNIQLDEAQDDTWIGLATYGTKTVKITFNGKARSKKEIKGHTFRTWNHKETILAAFAHELGHLKHGNVPLTELKSKLEEVEIIEWHRRNWIRCIKAFFYNPKWNELYKINNSSNS